MRFFRFFLGLWAGCWLVVGAGAQAASADAPHAAPRVVVVLAGGGAKGFAHLAVLRRLEQDNVPIARIVGTSMGAVVGGLYASGLSIDEIERVIGNLDPARVALDQIGRLELPQHIRAYQRQYPIELEFGVRQGALSFARGVSDGQRFLALLQQLTAHVPAGVSFNDLKIPFRAVATRYRDGEMQVFDHGTLHLAIRASMAAPAVFAPVEIDGETYVDGGLVANLPVAVALQEGAEVLVASYLAQEAEGPQADDPANALTVANRMLDILIRQNEKRNRAMLRPQDILVQPELKDVGFADFNRAAEIVQRGEKAVAALDARWRALAHQAHVADTAAVPRLAYDQREKRIVSVRVTGAQHVPERFIERRMAPLVGEEFRTDDTARRIDELYTSGYFESVHYAVEQVKNEQYELVVHVREKPYAPHFMKTSLGFSSELGGVNQFSLGLGYRHPWLTESGLELALDARVGTQSELAARLYQSLGAGWGLEAGAGYERNIVPLYAPSALALPQDQKLGYMRLGRTQIGAHVVYQWERLATVKLGVVQSHSSYTMDTPTQVILPQPSGPGVTYTLADRQVHATGLRWQFEADQLDSANFPSKGYFASGSLEQGLTGTAYRTARLSARWALPMQAHTLNLGVNWGREVVASACASCLAPTSLYLGGFQMMGAYRMGQLSGDHLAHVYGTYMYRLFDGGLLKQKTHAGMVLEAGDAWFSGQAHSTKYSASLFIAVDSKMGDIYLGAARGSAGANNVFLQLGRRFSF